MHFAPYFKERIIARVRLLFSKPWFTETVLTVTFPLSGSQQLDSIHVTQLERDTVLVCLDSEYYFKVYFECTTS